MPPSAFRPRRFLLAAVAALGLTGCETPFTTIAPEVSTEAPRMGHVKGEATSHLLFGSPSYNFIPIGWEGRTDRACNAATGCVEGANALVDVTLQERWYWWVIGSARVLEIEGDATVRR